MPITFVPTDDTSENHHRVEPIPGEQKRRRGRPPGSSTGAKVETQIKDELTVLFGLASMMWGVRDPQCASVFDQQSAAIAANLAKLAAKSKWARTYLQKVADIGEILPLFLSVYPVVRAVHEHHVKPKMDARTQQVFTTVEDMFDPGNA